MLSCFVTSPFDGSQSCSRRLHGRQKMPVCAQDASTARAEAGNSRRDFLRWTLPTVAGALILPCLSAASLAAEKEKKSSGTKKPRFTKENGILFYDLKTGTGSSPEDGDFVIVDWVAYLSNGTIFDNTTSPGRNSVVFRMGQKKVIPGIEAALSSMKQGGVRKIIVPPDLAYGDRGVCIPDQGCLVPPGETLEYDLTLKRVAISPI